MQRVIAFSEKDMQLHYNFFFQILELGIFRRHIASFSLIHIVGKLISPAIYFFGHELLDKLQKFPV